MLREQNYSLTNYNTFGIKAIAKQFIEYKSIKELQKLLPHIKDNRWLHIGRGSNLLFTKDFDGTILHSKITDVETIEVGDDYILTRIGAGVEWDEVCRDAAILDLYGCENLSLIPGEIGAAAVQNIGAYGVEVKDIIHKVEAVEVATGVLREFSNNECHYGYRNSIFKNELKGKYIITHVTLRLSITPQLNLTYKGLSQRISTTANAGEVRETIIAIRQSKLPDPQTLGSAGSFFKNPIIDANQCEKLLQNYSDMPHFTQSDGTEKLSAAWLIDHSGLKGAHVGDAQVYHQQPLVIVNNGNATANDIIKLAQHIQQTVNNNFGVQLEPEVNYI